MRQRVINRSPHPEMLDSGQQLAAAGTHGSVREDVPLSEGDRKRLGTKITVVVIEEPAEESAPQQAVPAPRNSKRKSE